MVSPTFGNTLDRDQADGLAPMASYILRHKYSEMVAEGAISQAFIEACRQ